MRGNDQAARSARAPSPALARLGLRSPARGEGKGNAVPRCDGIRGLPHATRKKAPHTISVFGQRSGTKKEGRGAPEGASNHVRVRPTFSVSPRRGARHNATRSPFGAPPRRSPEALSPTGSAPGHASWDSDHAGVTRRHLSQSRDCTSRTGRSTGVTDAQSRPGAARNAARRNRSRSTFESTLAKGPSANEITYRNQISDESQELVPEKATSRKRRAKSSAHHRSRGHRVSTILPTLKGDTARCPPYTLHPSVRASVEWAKSSARDRPRGHRVSTILPTLKGDAARCPPYTLHPSVRASVGWAKSSARDRPRGHRVSTILPTLKGDAARCPPYTLHPSSPASIGWAKSSAHDRPRGHRVSTILPTQKGVTARCPPYPPRRFRRRAR